MESTNHLTNIYPWSYVDPRSSLDQR